MYRILPVMNELIRSAADRGVAVSIVTLPRLTYFTHGWFLALTGQPLISGEWFRAFRWGPNVDGFNSTFESYGYRNLDPIPADNPVCIDCQSIDDDHKQLVERIIDVYGGFTAEQIVALATQKDTPWFKIWNDPPNIRCIPDTMTMEYFKSKLNKPDQ